MPPEQFAGQEADGRSDIWGFRTVLYSMVTGQKAFSALGEDRLSSGVGILLQSAFCYSDSPCGGDTSRL